MPDDNSKIIRSALSQSFTSDGITVTVQIFKLGVEEGWTLELVDENWNSTVWTDVFPTDQAAWDVFKLGAEKYGLAYLLRSEGDEPLAIH